MIENERKGYPRKTFLNLFLYLFSTFFHFKIIRFFYLKSEFSYLNRVNIFPAAVIVFIYWVIQLSGGAIWGL
jgi:hypothetical protein